MPPKKAVETSVNGKWIVCKKDHTPLCLAVQNSLDWLIELHLLDTRFGTCLDDFDLAEEIVEDTDLWNRVPVKNYPGENRTYLREHLSRVMVNGDS